MNTRTLFAVAFACLLNAAWPKVATSAEETKSEMSTRLEATLEAFNSKPDCRNLGRYAEELYVTSPEQLSRSATPWFKEAALVRILAAVERKMDPRFNPDDPPARNISPPGNQYPSGVAPSAIQDENTRKEYEAKLSANRAKTESFNLQTDLARVHERVVGMLQTRASSPDRSRSEALTEFTKLLNQYSIAEDARSTILEAARQEDE